MLIKKILIYIYLYIFLELVLKIRTSEPPDQDFIEIEVPLKQLSYENVFKTCCEELLVLPQNVTIISLFIEGV